MDLARYIVEAVELEGRRYRDVAEAHGVSKSWVAKLVARYRAGGEEAIKPRSKVANQIANRTPSEIEEAIVLLRKAARRARLRRRCADDPLPPRSGR